MTTHSLAGKKLSACGGAVTGPAKAGESVRIVGMDDFIVGAQGRKINAFYDIVMNLVARFPRNVHFFRYDTGGIGEVIEVDETSSKKKLVRKVTGVPIELMAALERGGLLSRGLRAVPLPHPALLAPRSPCSPGVNPGSLGGTNEYAKGRLGTEYVVRCEGADLSGYDSKSFHSDEQVEGYVADLVDGRGTFTEEIAARGLRKDIRELAHRELDAMDARTNCIQARLAGTVGHHPFAR